MERPRKNEKKYHTEIIDNARALGAWAHKNQRHFVKGIPDIDIKMPKLPFVRIEVKHETYSKPPKEIPIDITRLQRLMLRDMQAVGISCGWMVFVTIDKRTYVYYSDDHEASAIHPSWSGVGLHSNTGKLIGEDEWTKGKNLLVLTKVLHHLTRPPTS